jgi:hypothetical protein
MEKTMRKTIYGAVCALSLLVQPTIADGAYSRRKPITIDFNQVAGPTNLPNFPVLVSLVDTDLRLAPAGEVTSAKGYDILFRGEDDTTCGGVGTSPCVLAHEIETYQGSTGTLVAFVRVPVLQTAANTIIYMYYGDAAVTCSQESSAGVWDSSFREVYHLDETGDYADSTANAFTAVTKGTVTQGVAGRIGAAARFNGPTESRVIASDGGLNASPNVTFEAWIQLNSLQTGLYTGLVTKGRDGPEWFGLFKDNVNRLVLGWPCCGGTKPGNLVGPVLSTGTWYHAVATFNGVTKDRRLYLDGVQVAFDNGADLAAVPEYLRIGDDSNQDYHDGIIDEVRVSDSVRSPDWIQTSYNNQFAPGTFYAVGPENSSPPIVNAPTSCSVEAPCQGIGNGACHYRSIGIRPDYGTAAAEGAGTTVSAIASSPIVNGTGTNWITANRGRGDRITIDGTDYTILAITSETQLRLSSPFVGATGGGKSYTIARKFGTLQAWEGCIDGPGGAGCEGVFSNDLVLDNRGEIGIIYDDGSSYTYPAVGTPVLNINGSITDQTHTITLTADAGNRHNGTANTGVVIDNNANTTWAVAIQDEYATVEWVEITGGNDPAAPAINIVAGSPQNQIRVANNLIRNVSGRGIRINSVDARVDVTNNIVYATGSQPFNVNQVLAPGSRVRVLNNTFYNPSGSGLSSTSTFNPYLLMRNNIIFDSSPGFNVTWMNVGSSNNLSDDAAPPMFPAVAHVPDAGHSPRGGGVYGAAVASVNFIDTTLGAENLHIQNGSSARDVAASLNAVFTIDIDGVVRDLPWDIGADDFGAAQNLRSIGTRQNYGTAAAEGVGTTVTATNGSAIVSGLGTMWHAANRGRGDRIQIDLVDYTILSVDSETQLTLAGVFTGTSGSGKSYTISRKFSTLVAWEDCIDGPGGVGCEGVASANLVTDNRNEIGIVYDDSPLAAGLVIDGSVTDASHTITLTADPGNRHLGIENGGAVIDNGAVAADAISIQDDHVTLEWLEIRNGGANGDAIDVSNLSLGNFLVLRNLLVRDITGTGVQLDEPDLVARVYNNFVYSCSTRGIRVASAPTANASIEIYNNTLYANNFHGIDASGAGSPAILLRNNVAANNTPFNYNVNAGLRAPASSHNLASDTTGVSHSPAGNGLNSVVLASLNFVSTTVTYVDLHIQVGSAAEGNGADLSAIFANDIDGETRDSTWDRGADFISTAVNYRSIGTRPNYGTAQPQGGGTTVSATTGSTIVTGAGGTTWLTSNRGRGDRITINGIIYTVLRVDSNTQLRLTGPFEQASASGLTYSIQRKFTTLAAWEQCVDGTVACEGVSTGSLVADNRREVGIAYKDSAFGASVAIQGATTDSGHFITLTADDGNRHYGVAGQGVYIVGTEVLVENDYTVVEWLEVRTSGGAGFRVRDASNVLLQFLVSQGNADGVAMAGAGGNSFTIRNSIIYGNSNDGIAGDEADDAITVENCTVFGNLDQGIEDNNSPFTIRNTISMNNGANDYSVAVVTGSNNISSDGSTAGAGTLTNRVATANPAPGAGNWVMFQSISLAGENLHLIDHVENDAINNAAYLGGSFTADIDGGMRATPWDVGADDVVATTAVELVRLEAIAEDGAVEIHWETASELDNLGFHLYRARTGEGPYARLTQKLVPGLGSSPLGARYRYRDDGLENGTTYFYRLEDVDTSGVTTLHGPVSATPSGEISEKPREDDLDGETGRIRFGDPERSSLEVVQRGKFEVLIELRTEGFYATPLGDGTVRLEIPGFESAETGVPLRLAWVDVVAGQQVDLDSTRATDIETFPNLIPAGETLQAQASRDGTVRASKRRSRSAVVSALAVARISTVAFLGDEKKALVELSPIHWDGRSLHLAKRVVVRLSLRRRDGSETSADGGRGRRQRVMRSSSNVLVRLATREAGLHAVRYEDVFKNKTRLRADELVLRHRSLPVPFRISPPTGRFGPGSVLFFVSDSPARYRYGNELVYELARGEDGVPMLEASAPPTGTGETIYRDRIELEENRLYQAGLLDAPDIWLWDLVMGGESKSFSFDVRDLASGDGALRVCLQGTSDLPAEPDHHVRLFLNGTLLGDERFDGKRSFELVKGLPSGLLVSGENSLEIENVGDTEAAYSMVMLDRFQIEYPRRTLTPNAYVVDVTDRPRWVEGVEPAPAGARFEAAWDRHYLVTPVDSVPTPEIRVPPPVELRKPLRADYIAIGPAELLDAIQPLLAHRLRQGLVVRTASVEAIYEEFGFGEPAPEAIREFLAYAYHEWRRPSPRYVLLVGDATYDFKGELGTGVVNGVPPYMIKTSFLWTASDPGYAAVNGDDFLPDLAIGRLPASTPGEALALARKILAYESGGYAIGDAPVVLVTDDPDAAGDFDQNASDLADGILRAFEPERISLKTLGREPTRERILSTLDHGASLVSYIGHGGIHLWASENILNRSDVAELSPQARQPILLTMNCLNGYFHFPYFDALAEAMVTADGRGAIAAFAPSGLSLDAPAHRFHQVLLEALLDRRNARLGDAVMAAQKAYLETGSFPELLRIYQLLGDPALALR